MNESKFTREQIQAASYYLTALRAVLTLSHEAAMRASPEMRAIVATGMNRLQASVEKVCDNNPATCVALCQHVDPETWGWYENHRKMVAETQKLARQLLIRALADALGAEVIEIEIPRG